jgi:2-polyprenyl-3-methyl-5-hydroxy-6-metoxy-1,4-benzoquinol methylase
MDEMDRDFWNDAYQQDPGQVVVDDHILDQELEGLPVGTALDLGCGSGPNALKLARRGWSVVGVDWAEHAIQLATQAARDQGLDATFVVGDITQWEPPGKFDLVISTYFVARRSSRTSGLSRERRFRASSEALMGMTHGFSTL